MSNRRDDKPHWSLDDDSKAETHDHLPMGYMKRQVVPTFDFLAPSIDNNASKNTTSTINNGHLGYQRDHTTQNTAQSALEQQELKNERPPIYPQEPRKRA